MVSHINYSMEQTIGSILAAVGYIYLSRAPWVTNRTVRARARTRVMGFGYQRYENDNQKSGLPSEHSLAAVWRVSPSQLLSSYVT